MKDYTHIPDVELLTMIKSSDSAAFNELYKRYWEYSRLSAMRMTSDNYMYVDDIVHDIFLSLDRIKEVSNVGANLKRYLTRSIRNKIIDYYRKSKRRSEVYTSLADFANELTPMTDEGLILNELEKLIEEGINQMPEMMKQVFIMSRKQFLTHEEIAGKLNIATGTVKKQVQNANKFLRTFLKLRLTLLFVHFLLLLNKIINFFS